MWTRSGRFDDTIWGGHVHSTAVQILQGEDVIADLGPLGIVVDGSVSCAHAETQRTGALSIVDLTGELSPQDADDLFSPVGNQVRLWSGIDYQDGTAPELVPILTGRYKATTADFPRIDLSAIDDRSFVVKGALLESVLTVVLGTLLTDVIGGLVQTAYPGVPMNLPDSEETTNAMVFDVGTDPWAAAQDLAANLEMRLFFDAMGVLQMAHEPSDGDSPVWVFDDTDPACMALPGVAVTLGGEGFNSVTVIAENSDLVTPLRSTARDTDPSSPMQYGGRFGKRVMPPIRDDKIASQAQCDARARQELQNQLGLVQQITIPCMPHPAWEVMDPLLVAISRQQLTGFPPIRSQFAILDSMTQPLRAGAASITTRAKRIVENV